MKLSLHQFPLRMALRLYLTRLVVDSHRTRKHWPDKYKLLEMVWGLGEVGGGSMGEKCYFIDETCGARADDNDLLSAVVDHTGNSPVTSHGTTDSTSTLSHCFRMCAHQ